MTPASLNTYSQKDLAQMARRGGVAGWHTMRKEQLVKALLGAARAKAPKSRAPKPVPGRRTAPKAVVSRSTSARRVAPNHKAKPTASKSLTRAKAKLSLRKNLALNGRGSHKPIKDRIVVMVRDSFWLHANWELTRQSVERAEAAMKQDWHTARPILRLLEVSDGGAMSASERVSQDVEVHGGVSNWYLHVNDPPKSYRIEIGYKADSGRFFSLARSNVVTTPAPGASDSLDENWTDVAENFDKIYALSGGWAPEGATSTELQDLFEERLRRPMASPVVARYGVGMEGVFGHPQDLKFDIDAEMIIYGATRPDAHVTLRGEPIKLRPDGTFTVRMAMPNQRQVIPAVACAANGIQQRTIVLAIERNTKVMEPMTRESDD